MAGAGLTLAGHAGALGRGGAEPRHARGIGEIGTAAIGNAVYTRRAKRIRDLPITPDKLLAGAIELTAR